MNTKTDRVGVYIIHTGELTSIVEDRFKFAQILKASFLIDFNAARIMTKDLFIKLRNEPNTPYPIKGFNFNSKVFDELASKYKISYRYIFANAATLTDITPEETNTIQLVKNYRSTPNIVAFTNDIAKHFNERIQNHIPCESAALGLNNMKVFLKEKISQEFNIVREIKQRLEKGISLDEMAVLVRTNFETYKLEAALKREKIPFIKLGGNELYETKEVKIMIATYLTCC